MSKPQTDINSSTSSGLGAHPGIAPTSSGTASTSQQPSSGTARDGSSGPVSSYSGDQSTGTGPYSHMGYSSSGTAPTNTPGVGGGMASGAPSPFYSPPAALHGPAVGQGQQQWAMGQQQWAMGQPGSTNTVYGPPSSMIGVGGTSLSSSGNTGMQGYQPMYTSSNGPSTYSPSLSSQPMNGMNTASMNAMNAMHMGSGMPPGHAGAYSYPAMGPVGAQPLPVHGPMSALGPIIPGMHSAFDSAAAKDDARRLADGAAQDVGAYAADRAHLIHFRPKLGDKLVCTCPMVCLVNTSRGLGPNLVPQAIPLEMSFLQYNVQCHISQAFVELKLVCQYTNTWPDMPCVFFLPKTPDTTITEIEIKNTVRPTVQTTMVVPIEDFRKYGGKRGAVGPEGADDPANKLDPELFMLPIANSAPGDRYEVRVKYFHPMQFDSVSGSYVLELPTVVPHQCLPQGVSVTAVLEANVAIDTAMGGKVDLSVNYPHKVTYPCTSDEEKSCPGSVAFQLDNSSGQAWPDNDLLVQYKVWRDNITAVVQVEPPAPESGETLGTFVLSVMPPGPEESVCFRRDVIFVFDRSGSMTGEPMRYAKAALLTGLWKLDPGDRFGVVAFDHDQHWWTDTLMYATPEAIRTCMLWVNDDISARGTTDIKTPLVQALHKLQSAPRIRPDEVRMPVVFLLTDGCVDNEREICRTADSMLHNVPDPTAVPLITVDTHHRLVDAGQYVGVGLDKPTPLQQQQGLQQPSSTATSAPGTNQGGSGTYSSGPHTNGTAGPANGTAGPTNGTAGPTSEAWQSTGSSIMQPGSGSGGCYSSSGSSGKALTPRIFTFGIGPFCNHYFLKRLAAIGRGMNDVAFRAHAIQASMEQMLHAAALPILSDLQLEVQGLSHIELFPDPIPDVFVGQPLLVSGKFAGPWPEAIHLVGTLPSGEVYRHEVKSMPPQLSGGQLPLDSIFAKSQLDQLVANAWLQNNPPAMVDQILSLSLKRNIPVANYTVAVGFETTPQRMDQMRSMTPEQRRKHLVKYAIGGAAGILAVGGVVAALAFGSLAMTAGELPIGDIMSGGDIFSGLGDMGDCCGGCGDCCGDCGDICGACVTC